MENTKTFKIQRGMVFYLEEPIKNQPVGGNSEYAPLKSRPYIVISNDRCNENSAMINVAPLYTRTQTDVHKWYQIPFKCGVRDSVVDIGAIMLIPKTLCTETNYADYISQHTFNNTNLFKLIGEGIARQFDIANEALEERRQRIYDSIKTVEAPVANQPQVVVPNIVLNISVNGVPVNAEDVKIEQVADNNEKIVLGDPKNTTKTEDSHLCEVVNKPYKEVEYNSEGVPIVEKKQFGIGYQAKRSKAEEQAIKDYIIKNYRGFNGKMSQAEIRKKFNIGSHVITKYVSELVKEGYVNTDTNVLKRTSVRYDVPADVFKVILATKDRFTMNYAFKKFGKKFGFTSFKSFQQYVYRRIRNEVKELQKEMK